MAFRPRTPELVSRLENAIFLVRRDWSARRGIRARDGGSLPGGGAPGAGACRAPGALAVPSATRSTASLVRAS